LQLNGTHELLVYAVDVNLFDENINIVKKSTEAILDGSTEGGLEVSMKKTKYILMSNIWE
jgi:hypothetical protein